MHACVRDSPNHPEKTVQVLLRASLKEWAKLGMAAHAFILSTYEAQKLLYITKLHKNHPNKQKNEDELAGWKEQRSPHKGAHQRGGITIVNMVDRFTGSAVLSALHYFHLCV